MNPAAVSAFSSVGAELVYAWWRKKEADQYDRLAEKNC
jgi:hypothetical protein